MRPPTSGTGHANGCCRFRIASQPSRRRSRLAYGAAELTRPPSVTGPSRWAGLSAAGGVADVLSPALYGRDRDYAKVRKLCTATMTDHPRTRHFRSLEISARDDVPDPAGLEDGDVTEAPVAHRSEGIDSALIGRDRNGVLRHSLVESRLFPRARIRTASRPVRSLPAFDDHRAPERRRRAVHTSICRAMSTSRPPTSQGGFGPL